MYEKRKEYGAVNIIATTKEKILLIKDLTHQFPKWKFAGGHMEKGETPAYAAMRELKEETGLVAHIDNKNKILIKEYPNYSKTIFHIKQRFILIENLYTISNDWELVKIFSLNEISKMGTQQIVPEHYKLLQAMQLI